MSQFPGQFGARAVEQLVHYIEMEGATVYPCNSHVTDSFLH